MDNLLLILQKTLIYAIPLLIVALGGCFAERSGIINLALEGEMIFGAFIGALCVRMFQGADGYLLAHPQLMFLVALLISGISGAIFSLLLSFASVKLKADQTIAGTALNLLAPAIFVTICLAFFNQEKLVMLDIPKYAIKNSELPFILAIFFDKAYLSTFVCIALFVVLSIWLYKSKVGMHLRACGEHPQAANSVGINVFKMRYLGTTISGFLAGVGGYAFIAASAAGTAESSVGGMGFLALAIMIFGNWNPVGIALGALLFGFLKCVGPLSGQIDFFKNLGLPIYFYNIIPYLIVIIVLIISRKKSGCPKAEGQPYDKGQR